MRLFLLILILITLILSGCVMSGVKKNSYTVYDIYKANSLCKKVITQDLNSNCKCDETGIANYVVLYTDANINDINRAQTLFFENRKTILRNMSAVNRDTNFLSAKETIDFFVLRYSVGKEEKDFFVSKDGKFLLVKCK